MNKETIRPLLVEALEKAQTVEVEAFSAVRALEQGSPSWEESARVQEVWQAARLARAGAEVKLWLADRQWEREEKTWEESLQEVKQEAEESFRRNASPITKP